MAFGVFASPTPNNVSIVCRVVSLELRCPFGGTHSMLLAASGTKDGPVHTGRFARYVSGAA
jgi:hypothetical protein